MEYVKIDDIAKITRGVTYKKQQSSKVSKEGFIPLFRANNISNHQFIDDDLVFIPQDIVTDEQYINSGDIIITMSSGSKKHVGKVALAKSNYNITYGAFCSKITPVGVDPAYLFYVLRTDSFRKYIEEKCSGTNINNIRQSFITEYQFLLPSFQEQKRIVARIEELFSNLNSAVETLQKTKQQLEVYRQAVLREAFLPFRDKIPLKDIMECKLGKMLDKNKNKGIERQYIRNANVRWFGFDLNDLLLMRISDEEVERYSVIKGDLIICEGGEPGRCAIWNYDEPMFYQKALHRVRFVGKHNAKFYMYYFYYLAKCGQLKHYFTGSGIKHLTKDSLSKVTVPIAEKENQDNVVNEIEAKLSVCENIENTVDEALQQAEAMRQSILKQAFEGELNEQKQQ